MQFDKAKFAVITVRPGVYKDKQGGRVDMTYIGEPDSNLCSYMGTDREGNRRFYRMNGTCPQDESRSVIALWPADEPDRYFPVVFDAEQEIFGIAPTRYADGGQLRKEWAGKTMWAIRIGRTEDNNPEIELITFEGKSNG